MEKISIQRNGQKDAAESIVNKALVQIAGIYEAEEALKDLTAEDRVICCCKTKSCLTHAAAYSGQLYFSLPRYARLGVYYLALSTAAPVIGAIGKPVKI